MRYIGNISGDGILTWSGTESHAVHYELEGFYQERDDSVKTSGQVRGLAVAAEDILDRDDITLSLSDGRILDVTLQPFDDRSEEGAFEIDVSTPVSEFMDKKPRPTPRTRRRPFT
jgi:hypothetical protein